jgi:hypothetical protein
MGSCGEPGGPTTGAAGRQPHSRVAAEGLPSGKRGATAAPKTAEEKGRGLAAGVRGFPGPGWYRAPRVDGPNGLEVNVGSWADLIEKNEQGPLKGGHQGGRRVGKSCTVKGGEAYWAAKHVGGL